MNGDRITIDEAALRRNLQAFLRSPAAEPVYEELEIPFYVCLLGAVLLLVVGTCMLPTVIWTLAGLQAIWSVLKLEPFKPAFDNPRKRPESLVPLICHGIIIGPDRKHALVLGTFLSPARYSADWLAQKAAHFGQLYSGEATPASHDAELLAQLRDDVYRPGRRRRVPASHSDGTELLLFDVEVNPYESQETPFDTVLFAFVAEPGEKGDTVNIPWKVAQDAVRIV